MSGMSARVAKGNAHASSDRTLEEKSCRAAKRIFGALGPGLITGASDDDPSGIATYSQAGAQFGFSIMDRLHHALDALLRWPVP